MKGKIVFITGASSGIGEGCARKFASQGSDLILNARNVAKLEELKVELEAKYGVRICLLPFDVRDRNAATMALASLPEEWKRIDVLVNNAGISLVKQINDTTAEEYDKIMRINAKSYFLCSREAVKLMLKSHSGAIVNVSSMWGQLGASCEIAYSMSKAAIIGLSRSLAQELAPSGITVNCVCPGIIDTRMNSMFEKSELEEEVPIGRLGTAEEVADAIYFLSQNKYITSQILGVNGGIV